MDSKSSSNWGDLEFLRFFQPSSPVPIPRTNFLTSDEDSANIFSHWFMFYLNPLFFQGYNFGLQHDDLGIASKQDQAKPLYDKFYKEWQKELKVPAANRSLWMVLWRTVGYWKLAWGLFLYGAFAAISFGPVMILNALVKHFQGSAVLPDSILWLYVALMFVLPMSASVFCAQSNNTMAHIGLQFRNCLIDMIYRKALLLSPAARQKSSTGQIVNMFSNDTGQLQRYLFFVNNMCLAPAQIAISLALIYQQVGPSTFVGLALMLIMMPMNGFIFDLLNVLRTKKVKITDKRVKLMNEILTGIRIIKYYAWERAFESKITVIRLDELNLLRDMAYIVAVGFTLIMMAAPILQPVVIFYTYVRLGNTLDAAKAFTTIALFNMMQMPFAFLPLGLSQYSQSLVSTKRMLDFFVSDELSGYVQREPLALPSSEPSSSLETSSEDHFRDVPTVISVKNASLGWVTEEAALEAKNKATNAGTAKETSNKDNEKEPINRSVQTLTNIDFSVKKGMLVAVVGPVGSGKSSLLNALLGEMNLKGWIKSEIPGEKGHCTEDSEVRVIGSVSYCDQRPWVLNNSVKDNILFGKAYDEALFESTLNACGLKEDLAILPAGIDTEIGEKGINLSGGQKARVALARAVYRDTEIYLLDDPLSAIDAHVGQHIFNNCISGVLAGKTRILVTHHVHYLNRCDMIVIIGEDGTLKGVGTFEELQRNGVNIEAFIPKKPEEVKSEVETVEESIELPSKSPSTTTTTTITTTTPLKIEEITEEESKEDIKSVDSEEKKIVDEVPAPDSAADLGASSSESKIEDELGTSEKQLQVTSSESSSKSTPAETESKPKPKGKLMTIEERKLGDVDSKTYSYYLRAGGIWTFFWVIVSVLCAQGLTIGANFWLSHWGQVSVAAVESGKPLSSKQNVTYLNYFALLSGLGLILTTVRALLLAQHRLGTSIKLHTQLLKRILNAPISFFDVTPLGRILNRFSSDLLTVDEDLSQTISQIINSFFSCLGALGAICGATKGTFLILLVPLSYFYLRVQSYFRKTNTTVARLESISRSPIYSDFSQVLSGLTSIRAYQDEPQFISHLESLLDRNSIAAITQVLAGQWLAIRLDFLGSFVTFFIALIAVASSKASGGQASGFMTAGFIGVGLSYSFQLTGYLKFAVRVIATGEAQMNSVERLMYYIENVEQEGNGKERQDWLGYEKPILPASGDGSAPAPSTEDAWVPVGKGELKDWPARGEITAQGLEMSYRDGPLVLKGIDFQINSHEKIGVAGRTGSGKSSLMAALYRVEEIGRKPSAEDDQQQPSGEGDVEMAKIVPHKPESKIWIDGVDISTIPLPLLRSKLGIIPQDPVMFSATLRFNLDPFHQYTDSSLWSVLDQVKLKDAVQAFPNKLGEEISEGGDNLSAGQRQLICIARALLKKPKILILDEATASIDNETDALIQTTLRSSFPDSTLLIIAHRLHTIIDADRIMILDHGVLKELDSPATLLHKEGGIFRSLWEKHQSSHGH